VKSSEVDSLTSSYHTVQAWVRLSENLVNSNTDFTHANAKKREKRESPMNALLVIQHAKLRMKDGILKLIVHTVISIKKLVSFAGA
jgi:hypothetical protein